MKKKRFHSSKKLRKSLIFTIFFILNALTTHKILSAPASYLKATAEDDEVVRNKLFPKSKKIELSAPDLGIILNQSYITSFVLHSNLNYYFNENWGISLEGLYVINIDKSERYCIEHFYNDYKNEVSLSCPGPDQDPAEPLYTGKVDEDGNPLVYSGASFGPAYPRIRELDYAITASAIWSPVYGKQLAFLSNTIYLDLFFSFGAGLTFSTLYPNQIFLKSNPNQLARGPAPETIPDDCDSTLPGVCPDSAGNYLNDIGENGRPDPLSESTPTITVGVGQKVHFKKRFNFKAEIRNYTLFDSNSKSQYESFFMAWIGLGMRI